MKSIKKIAEKYGISELSVWELIRKGIISSKIIINKVAVDESEVENYFNINPKFLEVKRKKVDERLVSDIY